MEVDRLGRVARSPGELDFAKAGRLECEDVKEAGVRGRNEDETDDGSERGKDEFAQGPS